MSKLENKLENFANALKRLNEAVVESKQANASDVVRDGMIQRFEFTYELAWKTTKEYLEQLGIADLNSPKSVMKEAYARKIITDEETWLLIMKDRNLTPHVYREEVTIEIAERIMSRYVAEFEALLQKLV